MARINLNLNINKVLVACNNYDLLERGFYSIDYNEHATLSEVRAPQSVLMTTSGKSSLNWVNTDKWDFPLRCGYYGKGPLDLQDFILKNGAYKGDDLFHKIKSNNVVIYDFDSNDLEAYNTTSTFDYYPFHVMAKRDGTIVFLLEFAGISTHRSHNSKYRVIPDVQKTIHFASRMFNTDLQAIMYIGDTESSSFMNHTVTPPKMPREHYYNLILDFSSFEIWIDYPFSLEQKTIQFDDEFRQILHGLNYPIINKKFDNGVLQAIDRFTKRDQQTNQVIWVTYEEDKIEY